MAIITFHTKLGCVTSLKQVDLLRQSGHEVEVRDLLMHSWQPEELTPYFCDMPVQLWFNPNSPRVKSGEIDPLAYDSASALNLMLEDHLLIRRPLMESGHIRICGFDPVKVHALFGLVSPDEALSRSADLQTCSQQSASSEPTTCP
jgi:nitrogenase-associated protein